MALGIGLEARQVDDRVLGREAAELVGGRAHEQRADEQVVPGELVDHAHVDAVLGLRAAEQVGDVERVLGAECGEEVGLEVGEVLGGHRHVDLAPPHGVLGLGVADDELVLGRAAGVLAGLDHQRAVRGKVAFAVADRVLDQLCGAEVGVNRGPGLDALLGQADGK